VTRWLCILATAFAGLALIAHRARAAPLFDVQFTGDTVTDPASAPAVAPANRGDVSLEPTSLTLPASIVVANGYTDSKNSNILPGSVAVITDASTTTGPAIVFAGDPADAAWSGEVLVQVDLLFDKTSAATGNFFLGLKNAAGDNISSTTLGFNGKASLGSFDADGTRIETSSIIALPMDQAVHVEMLLNLDRGSQKLTIGANSVTGTLAGGANLSLGQIYASNPALGTIAMDNFQISVVPEPAALGMLGLGGLALLKRRKGYVE
jgi:hypothetical protein